MKKTSYAPEHRRGLTSAQPTCPQRRLSTPHYLGGKSSTWARMQAVTVWLKLVVCPSQDLELHRTLDPLLDDLHQCCRR